MIDIAFAIVIFIGTFKGWRKGFVAALFSLLGFIIGLAAAFKLSGAMAAWLTHQSPESAKWIPFISFTVVFILTVFAVKFAGKALEKLLQSMMMGWANRTAGALIYAFLYVVLLSVFLFFIVKLKLIGTGTTNASVIYPYIKDIPSRSLNFLGEWIPFFKNTFHDLETFFEQFANKANQK